jgi:hypothetical protein
MGRVWTEEGSVPGKYGAQCDGALVVSRQSNSVGMGMDRVGAAGVRSQNGADEGRGLVIASERLRVCKVAAQ